MADRKPAVPRATRKSVKSSNPGFAEAARPFIYDDIVDGIDARRVKELIDREVLDAKYVYRVIPERTFNRRLANREPLKPAEGDAIARLLRVIEMANKTFSDKEFAKQFLSLPNPVLKDRIPFELAETDAGARQVETVLTRIAYGDYT